MVDKSLCVGCGACESMCPTGAIKVVNGTAKIDKSKCIKCGTCQNICPMQAIDLSKNDDEKEEN